MKKVLFILSLFISFASFGQQSLWGHGGYQTLNGSTHYNWYVLNSTDTVLRAGRNGGRIFNGVSTTRPAALAGSFYFDTDSARWVVHNGTSWRGLLYNGEAGAGGGNGIYGGSGSLPGNVTVTGTTDALVFTGLTDLKVDFSDSLFLTGVSAPDHYILVSQTETKLSTTSQWDVIGGMSISGQLFFTNGSASKFRLPYVASITSPTDGMMYYDTDVNIGYVRVSGAWVDFTTASGGSPGGSDGFVQYNNGGVFGATTEYYDDVNDRFGYGTSAPTHAITIASGQASGTNKGFVMYGTADQTTNYSRFVMTRVSNGTIFDQQAGGTGSVAGGYGFRISGSERMFIDATSTLINNNVVVGTNAFSPVTQLDAVLSDAATNTSPQIFTIRHATSGAAAANFGAAMQIYLENASSAATQAAMLKWQVTDATASSEDTKLTVQLQRDGTLTDHTVFNADGSVSIGTTTTDRFFHVEQSDAVTAAVTYTQRLTHISSGTVAANFGNGTEYELENASGTNRIAATTEISWTDATNATEDAVIVFKAMFNGTLTETFRATGSGDFTVNHLVRTGTTPTYTAGTGAGTTPTISVNGSDMAGYVSVQAGTTPANNATIVTVTFNRAYASTPTTVLLFPRDSNAADRTGIYANASNANGFDIFVTGTALTASTTYSWNYIVIQ